MCRFRSDWGSSVGSETGGTIGAADCGTIGCGSTRPDAEFIDPCTDGTVAEVPNGLAAGGGVCGGTGEGYTGTEGWMPASGCCGRGNCFARLIALSRSYLSISALIVEILFLK